MSGDRHPFVNTQKLFGYKLRLSDQSVVEELSQFRFFVQHIPYYIRKSLRILKHSFHKPKVQLMFSSCKFITKWTKNAIEIK